MDVIVIGGGISGLAIAYELAADREVLLLEAEKSLGLHTTGRSAATWIGSYGPPVVREFTTASHDYLIDPPFDIDGPVASPMSCLWLGVNGRDAEVHRLVAETAAELVDGAEAERLCPVLRPGAIAVAAWDETALDLDVMGLHHAYTRAFRARGGTVATSARVASALRDAGEWVVTTTAGDVFRADVVVNAAGAWGDVVGSLFGAERLRLEPRRRTLFQSPTTVSLEGVPFTAGIDDGFYFKAAGGAVLCSPQDATLHEPGDPKPDELEIARAIESVNDVTTLGLRSVRTAWAGLRTFAPDGNPVTRWDAKADGFFWYVGQAGYGIQMAPALAQHAAALIRT
ncbi:FAD-dependent oxidoreductase [Aeromicrobium sp. 636]|uniref:FAD-binding oxidoreductase n=1 Tax=Aeromicrobium senzhongii TaxID=2663859 RepID=A0A8I0EUH4_9ACTN|nr:MULTISPECIES: FAD-dependent oxidoreductase [Aeromicrobium]MBC9226364.1 FAD-binding oxidoreductase [Aeromicrobium senzhongii]MCQ3998469.1 FAD-dependent oxidoreductase [Aeromicrobium sp. 636]